MKTIIELNNIIKYDTNKCIQCRKCVLNCKTHSLSLYNGSIEFKKEFCIACKECIKTCDKHALYYNVNDGILEGNNTIAVIPFDADKRLLNKKYGNILTYELGEKVKAIETAFEMSNITNKKVNDEPTLPLIISDIENIDLIVKNLYPNFSKYLSRVKNVYYISAYLTRLINKNNNIKVISYAIPFETKMYFENIKMIDEICDIPYKVSHKYNIMDVLNTYMSLCKLSSNIDINNLSLLNNKILELKNKYVSVKVLLTKELSNLSNVDYSNYDFIFVCKETKYNINDNLLKDKDVNDLYKSKLKEPGKTSSILK